MKIGLLGGSFDPIHNGHVEMAKHAYRQLQLDEVWFVVAFDTPLKDRKLCDFEHRCAMVEYAVKKYPKFKVNRMESQMDGKSYTIDTVKRLRTLYPDHTFYFLMGEDQVSQLDKWKDIDELQYLVHLCAFERNHRRIETSYQVTPLDMDAYLISSSEVRNGNFLHVHSEVRKYAFQNELYYEFLQEMMSKKRYIHSLSVAYLCKEIALAHGLDGHKAYMCGLLHDIAKEYKIISKQQAEIVLKTMKPEMLNQPEAIWHGYLGAFVCAHQLYIQDKDILLAIENHVTGECRNAYAMIVYAADKLDPMRGYDSSATIALMKKNLYLGFEAVHKQQNEYLSKENISGTVRK